MIVPSDNLDDLVRHHLHDFRSALKRQDLPGARKKLSTATSVWQQLRHSLQPNERRRGVKSFRYRAVVGLANKLCEARALSTRVQDYQGIFELKAQRVLEQQLKATCRVYQGAVSMQLGVEQGLLIPIDSPRKSLATAMQALNQALEQVRPLASELDPQDIEEAESLLAKCQALEPLHSILLQLRAAKKTGDAKSLCEIIELGEKLIRSEQCEFCLVPPHILTACKHALHDASASVTNPDNQSPLKGTSAADDCGQQQSSSVAKDATVQPVEVSTQLQISSSQEHHKAPKSSKCHKNTGSTKQTSALEEADEIERFKAAKEDWLKALEEKEALERTKVEIEQQKRDRRRRKQALQVERREQEHKHQQQQLQLQRRRRWKDQEDEEIHKELQRLKEKTEERKRRQEEKLEAIATSSHFALLPGNSEKPENEIQNEEVDVSLEECDLMSDQKLDPAHGTAPS